MTVQPRRNSLPSPGLWYSTLTLAGAIAFGLLMSACGGGDAEGVGALENVTVTPEEGYPGVSVEVAFDIVPDDDIDEDEYSWNVDFGDGNQSSGSSIEASASHAYDDTNPEGYQIEIEALQDGAVADTRTVNFPVYDPVDLSVDSVNVQPFNVFATQDQVTISFDVENLSPGPVVTDFSVHTYLYEQSDVERDDISEFREVGSQTFEVDEDGNSLDGASSINASVTETVPDIPDGDYYAIVVLDPDDQVGVENPDQTIDTSSSTISVENLDTDLPNISVQNLEALPEWAFPELSQVTRGFTLANLGNEDVFEVVYDTYISETPSIDDSAEHIDSGGPINLFAQDEELIGPDELTLTDAVIPPSGEEIERYIIVEAYSEDGDVEEATTDNNILATEEPIVISDEPVDGPDIIVDSFSVSPESTFLDGVLEVDTTVANDGTEDVGSFFCGIYMNEEPTIDIDAGSQIDTLTLVGLDAGEHQQFNEEITVPAVHDPGTYYFFIVCDPSGAIDQPVRSNSQAIDLDAVDVTDEADIDLYVDEITLPDNADEGDTITAEASLCVAGSNPTGTTTAEVYTSSGSDVDFDAEPYKTVDIPNIDPGSCITRSFELSTQCVDFSNEMSVGVFADSEQTLPEDDTSNNLGTSTNPVTLSGQYCQCEDDGFGPNQTPLTATSLDVGNYEGALCDTGECDFYTTTIDEGESLLVDTAYDEDRGDLETTMYAPGGVQQLDQDDSSGYQQVAVFVAGDDDLSYVYSVCGQDDARNYYDFDVNVVPQPEGVDVRPRNLVLPPGDSYSLGQELDIDLRIYNLGTQASGDFDADIVLTDEPELGDPSDVTLSTHSVDSISAGSHRDVTLDTALSTQVTDGDYYIAVVLDPADDLDDQNPDENVLFSSQFSIDTDCFDAFSPNHSFDDAAHIDPGSYSNLIVCDGQSDYHAICASDATTVDATVEFDHEDGEIDTFLYDETFSNIDSSAQSGVGSETVSVDYVDGDQCFYLRTDLISVGGQEENEYSLDVDVNDVDPSLQCDSMFEPNDDFSTASSLWAALNYENSLDRCPSDDVDFYEVMLSTDSTVDFSATLNPSGQSGTLRLQLYGPNELPLETVETSPGDPSAEINNFQPSTTGTHYVRISVTGDEHSVTYDLDADGLPGVDLAAENLSIGSGNYEEGDKIRYDYDLINYGGDDLNSVDYEVFLGDTPDHDPDDDQFLGQFTIDDVDAGSSQEIEGQVNVPMGADTGDKYVHISVDPDDEHDDVNLDNNVDSVPIVIVEPTDDDDNGDNGDNGDDDDNGDNGDNGDGDV